MHKENNSWPVARRSQIPLVLCNLWTPGDVPIDPQPHPTTPALLAFSQEEIIPADCHISDLKLTHSRKKQTIPAGRHSCWTSGNQSIAPRKTGVTYGALYSGVSRRALASHRRESTHILGPNTHSWGLSFLSLRAAPPQLSAADLLRSHPRNTRLLQPPRHTRGEARPGGARRGKGGSEEGKAGGEEGGCSDCDVGSQVPASAWMPCKLQGWGGETQQGRKGEPAGGERGRG